MRDTPPAGPSERKEITIGDKVVVVEASGAVQIDGQPVDKEGLSQQHSAVQAAVYGATDILKAKGRAESGVEWVEPNGTPSQL